MILGRVHSNPSALKISRGKTVFLPNARGLYASKTLNNIKFGKEVKTIIVEANQDIQNIEIND